jgi:hypothetical protein
MIKVPASIRAEALRLAKSFIKDMLRAQGDKPTDYTQKEIARRARELIESDPSYIAHAKTTLHRK